MKVNRSVGVLGDVLVYSARLVIAMQKSACEKVPTKDYCSYALTERSIWESLTRRSLTAPSILHFEDASLYFVYLINSYALRWICANKSPLLKNRSIALLIFAR